MRPILFVSIFLVGSSHAVERVKMPNMAMDPGMQPKSAKVVFNNGVSGDIRMTQSDYKGPLEIKLNLKDLKDSVGPWHIHRLPVVSDCSANSTSGHYNPLAVTATYKACEDSAACEAGDLSTKFGPLTGGDVQRAITDPKLTLFGFNSIMGRSVVIHNEDGIRVACGTIKYDDEALVVATAEFKTGPYVGKATFSQPKDNNLADTQIFADLKMAEGVAAPTAPVAFSVFDAPCGTQGAKLLNPGALQACEQFENTSPFKPCALGDLSGRHGKLTLPMTGGQAMFITDYLPLSKEGSVVGMSLVVDASDATPAACADIMPAVPTARTLLRVSP